jgi:hypothetical protein
MSKSLLNLLMQISKLCQKSEFQIKLKKVLFLELGPAQVSAQPPGPWPSAGQLVPHSFCALASQPARLGPARPSPSLMHGLHPFIFLLRPIGHEAARHRLA